MNLENMTKEELEILSYTDLTYILLKENRISMNTATIFKKICELLEYSDEDYASKIGDFYTSLNVDKRFVLLDNNEWDLREKHSVAVVVDDDEEDEDNDSLDELLDEEDEEIEDYEEELEEEIDDDLDEEEDDDEDLTIIDEEEEIEEIEEEDKI